MSLGRGLAWRQDPDFLLTGHTVPTVLILHEGAGYRLYTSGPERGNIRVHKSEDGLNWRLEPGPVFARGQLPQGCGQMVLDVSFTYLPGSRYRMVSEGWNAPGGLAGEVEDGADLISLCSWTSADGDNWEWEEGFTPLEVPEETWPSVLAVGAEAGSGVQRLYYVNSHPRTDGIQVAESGEDGVFRRISKRRLLDRTHVDPAPVRLRDGSGWRLYHTHHALSGELGVADSADGLSFSNDRPLEGLSGQTCYTPPEQPSDPDRCTFDPFFLRLPDGKLVLYFGLFETTDTREERRGIARAFSVD